MGIASVGNFVDYLADLTISMIQATFPCTAEMNQKSCANMRHGHCKRWGLCRLSGRSDNFDDPGNVSMYRRDESEIVREHAQWALQALETL
jgi:hypothetical protein